LPLASDTLEEVTMNRTKEMTVHKLWMQVPLHYNVLLARVYKSF